MCVIVLKPKGIDVPSKKILKECYDYSSHGAGVAYWRNGENTVHVRKGFMTFKEFLTGTKHLNLTINDTVMYHFRIATAGKICKENTHPFPLSKNLNDLRSLSINTNCAIAHNGILDMRPNNDKKSDTMLFILNVLSDPIIYNNLKNNAIMALIDESIGYGKIALLHSNGEFTLYNESTWINENGVLYSNLFWKLPAFSDSTSYFSDNYWSYGKLKKTKQETTPMECPICYSNQIQEIDITGKIQYYWCFSCNTEFNVDAKGNINLNNSIYEGENDG